MIAIRHADVVIEVDERDGGRATSWSVSGHELLGRNSSHPIDYGMYPMAPWAGRIRDNHVQWGEQSFRPPVNFEPWAIHGLVVDRAFTVVEHLENRLVLEREFDEDWPFGGGVRCAWTLDDQGLTTEITCVADEAEYPAVLGWHPWFRREIAGAHASWHTDCTHLLARGDDSLPSGELVSLAADAGPFDDVLTGGRKASIEWPGLLRIDIENSHSWFVVYDATERFVCIEPQSGPADGLSGRHAPVGVVAPGSPLVMRTLWRVSREQRADSA